MLKGCDLENSLFEFKGVVAPKQGKMPFLSSDTDLFAQS